MIIEPESPKSPTDPAPAETSRVGLAGPARPHAQPAPFPIFVDTYAMPPPYVSYRTAPPPPETPAPTQTTPLLPTHRKFSTHKRRRRQRRIIFVAASVLLNCLLVLLLLRRGRRSIQDDTHVGIVVPEEPLPHHPIEAVKPDPGLGRCTPNAFDEQGPQDKLEFDLALYLPTVGRRGSSPPLYNVETSLPSFAHNLHSLKDVLEFQELHLESRNAPIVADSVYARNATIRTTNGHIQGSFDASAHLSLITTNALIDTTVTLHSTTIFKTTELVMQTRNGQLESAINLLTTSASGEGGSFNVSAHTADAPLVISFPKSPARSTLNFNGVTSNARADTPNAFDEQGPQDKLEFDLALYLPTTAGRRGSSPPLYNLETSLPSFAHNLHSLKDAIEFQELHLKSRNAPIVADSVHVRAGERFLLPTTMSTIDKDRLSLKIKTKGHYEYPRHIQEITLTAKHPQHGEVASLFAWRLVRPLFGDRFLQILDEDHQEMHDFSSSLFDKYGKALPYIIEPGFRSGSGVWGQELNEGLLFYVMMVSVPEKFRGQGIGSWALQKFLLSNEVHEKDTIFCWLSPMGIQDRAEFQEIQARQTAFFHKNNFRRVGRTSFLGYSPRSDHPSRRLPIDKDVADIVESFTPPDTATMQQVYPLHFAIVKQKGPDIVDAIRSAYNKDPHSIHIRDANGFTPLHAAAGTKNVAALRKLLEFDVEEDLRNVENANGTTPLELLQLRMRSDRDFAEMFLDNWCGYSVEELEAEYLLKRRLGSLLDVSLQKYIAKNKFGCSCGQCVDGWLSPRMRFQLESQAADGRDMMPEMYSFFKKTGPTPFNDVYDVQTWYLPRRLQPHFTLSFYKGYHNVFAAIYDILNGTNSPLSATTVHAHLGNGASSYLQHGGRLEFAFDAIMDGAYQQSELGDGYHLEVFGDYEPWTSLPTCANDLEFQLVRNMLGLNPKECWGPYDLPQGRVGTSFGFGDGEAGSEDEDEEEDQEEEEEHEDDGEI
uniref:Ankyrin repeat family protein n=1 Tax=Mycena chlorophos TaxID=658473 RepID=A0ABQ0LDB3_MYCCL|nr:ankyrin repeat family protein [Mycena chlorophos]